MKNILVILFTIFTSSVFAQNIEVHIEDSQTHQPLIGASVFWEGTQIGAATNAEGLANIPQPLSYPAKLILSYVGYRTDTILVKSFTDHLHVYLVETIELAVTDVKGKRKDNYVKSQDPVKIEVITQTELRKAACCNLSESFQTNASAQVNYEDAVTGAKQIELLGLKGIYVQNTIENTPALRGLSSSFALDNVPSPWIKSIELAKGTPSVRSGYEGITGSININYKTPEDLSPLYLDVFTNHTGRLEGNWMSAIHKKNWGTAFFANGAMTKDKKDRNEDSFYDQPQVNQVNLMNRWEFHNDKMESQFLIKGLHENRTSGQISLPEGKTEQYKIGITTNRVEGIYKMGFFLPGHLERSIALSTSGFWHDQKGVYGVKQYDGRQGSFYGNLLFRGLMVNTNHTLFAGASMMYDQYDENINGTNLKRKDIIPGLSTEYTYKYLEKITLVAGLRADFPNRFKAQINPRLHFKYAPTERTQIRLAGGRGFRIPNVFAENIYMFASSRDIEIMEEIGFESAWNIGISVMQDIRLGSKSSKLTVDYYHTRFTNQVMVDIENGHNKVHIYNLDGQSYSNSLLVEWTVEPIAGLDLKFAYRLEDVHQTMEGQLIRKSMLPPHRGLFAASYTTKNEKWLFSTNVNVQSKARYPQSFNNVEQQYTPVNAMLSAQITRYQGPFEFFIGGENLLNTRQTNPIIGYENPFGEVFDTYQAWGSPIGPVAYGGIRYNMKHKEEEYEEHHEKF